jgi:hypothetical protein
VKEVRYVHRLGRLLVTGDGSYRRSLLRRSRTSLHDERARATQACNMAPSRCMGRAIICKWIRETWTTSLPGCQRHMPSTVGKWRKYSDPGKSNQPSFNSLSVRLFVRIAFQPVYSTYSICSRCETSFPKTIHDDRYNLPMTEAADLVEDKANHILSGFPSIDLPDETIVRIDAPFSL